MCVRSDEARLELGARGLGQQAELKLIVGAIQGCQLFQLACLPGLLQPGPAADVSFTHQPVMICAAIQYSRNDCVPRTTWD